MALGLLFSFGMRAETGMASAGSRSALEQTMGDIQWGWSPKQVYRQLKKEIEASYQEPISKTTDAIEEDRLRHKMAEETREIRDSYLEFDGTPSAYDSGYLKGEFTHKNGESLLRVRTKNTQDFFFFINDRLWKRYRAFDASVFEGASFADFGSALQKRYGKAKAQSGVRTPGTPSTQWLEWRQPRDFGSCCGQQRILRLLLPDSRRSENRRSTRQASEEQSRRGRGQAVDWSIWSRNRATMIRTPISPTGLPARFDVTIVPTSSTRSSTDVGSGRIYTALIPRVRL